MHGEKKIPKIYNKTEYKKKIESKTHKIRKQT
jgi:hypothetical protein